ncbi:Sugar phosphatase YidA [Gracilariopsis chorda]|uniref:Sugar phosphatase YidA n=1 Tax=Gracilariopsis chorda TaxID=448386 RepID=A0A2V3IPG7_9FLOR|nr:Sugar phosphatase YidA [Gracilariopsis chorda]|eukprot:PXF43947.1 Sugar phosphatase YidA [Gracilariopsis chorda]
MAFINSIQLASCHSFYNSTTRSRLYPYAQHRCDQRAVTSTRAARRAIRLIASDIDGTLLTSAKRLHPRNEPSVRRAVSSGVLFVPATGKSMSGAQRALGHSLTTYLEKKQPGLPGIYLNGLLVRVHGRTIFEQTLEKEHVLKVLEEAGRRRLTPLLYAADNILVTRRSKHTDMFMVSFEPEPQAVNLRATVEKESIHKVLLVDETGGDVRRYRDEMTHALHSVATITQARPDVLEVLPNGANKGLALQHLLKHLRISNENAMAVGDGENDMEMLQTAGVAVATANAVPSLRRVAHHVVCANDEGAVADAIYRFVL